MINDVPERLYESYHPTGSFYICNPPVTTTDIDYVIFTEDFDSLHRWLLSDGWTICKGEGYDETDPTFTAYRQDQFNFIVVNDGEQFTKWIIATEKAKEQNLTNKADRIKLFNEVFGREEKKPANSVRGRYNGPWYVMNEAIPMGITMGTNAVQTGNTLTLGGVTVEF